MHFCEKCNNMYYIHIDETSESVHHFCRNCGNVNKSIIQNNNIIYEYNINQSSEIKLANAVNQYTKHDPTLPRTSNIPCPNKDCPCNKDSSITPEILYIKYDDDNINFMYLCYHCETTWHNNN